jgi:hypothetical protein
MMKLQTTQDWTWLLLLDERDPLLAERMAVFARATSRFEPLFWKPDVKDAKLANWDKNARLFTGTLDAEQARRSAKSRIAATAYHVDWADHMDTGARLMTRLDDDDALTRDSLMRTQRAAEKRSTRTVLMQPIGFRVWDGHYSSVTHTTNAMHSLFTPAGDELTVYDYGHRKCANVAPIVTVDRRPGWLWVRHPDTLSGWKKADRLVSGGLKKLFPIDWSLI